jgi:hypothetical protein
LLHLLLLSSVRLLLRQLSLAFDDGSTFCEEISFYFLRCSQSLLNDPRFSCEASFGRTTSF